MTDLKFWQDVSIRILPETLAELAANLDAAADAIRAGLSHDPATRTDALIEATCAVGYARGMVRHLQSRFPVAEQLSLVLATVEG